MTRHPVLFVDVGQTATRVQLSGSDSSAPGVSLGAGEHLSAPGAPARLAERVIAAWRSLGEPTLDGVLVVATGFVQDPADAALRQILVEVGAPWGRIADDVVGEFLCRIGFSAGILLIAGTGVACLASDGKAASARAGGWGWAIDDVGGGFWVGREGLQSAVRALEGRGGSSALLAAAQDRYGNAREWPGVIYGVDRPVARVAEFAGDVIDLVETGDHEAIRIWSEAIESLTAVAASTAERAGLPAACRLAVVGGLACVPESRWLEFVACLSSGDRAAWAIERPRRDGLAWMIGLEAAPSSDRFADAIVSRP
jgi:N-acetylglucosamine kinase-like BadF-type ATPase